MDTAKVARMLLSNPGPAEGIAGFGKRLAPHASILVAVPTTHGTGSEVSESAVIGKAGVDAKLIYRSQDMTPSIALLDPSLTVGAPRTVTAYAGYDAVTHAVEAFVSRMASPMTDPYAVSAMELLGRWLAVAYEEPENRDARGACLIASMQAAIAFNSANLGLAHAISGPLGAQQHVAHGLGNALALPYVTAFNEPVLGAKGETIAKLFGGRSAAEAMAKLRRRLGLDLSLDDYVRTDADRERLAQWAMKSGQVKMNPRAATLDDMRAIVGRCGRRRATRRRLPGRFDSGASSGARSGGVRASARTGTASPESRPRRRSRHPSSSARYSPCRTWRSAPCRGTGPRSSAACRRTSR